MMYLGDKPVKVAYDLPYKHTSVEEAFTSRQTANGLTLVEPSPAVVEMIKGKTVKSENLFNAQEGKTNTTKYVFDVGSITNNSMEVGAGDKVVYSHEYPAGTYTIALNIETNDTATDNANNLCRFLISTNISGFTYNQYYGGYFKDFKGSLTFTANEPFTIGFGWAGTAGYKKAFTNIRLNNGTTAKPYTPFFSGLKHAYFKAIKSTGKNLLNIFGRTKGAHKDFSNATVRDYLTDKEYYIGLSRVNYEIPSNISVEFNADGFTVRNGGSGYGVAFPVKCKANTAYTLSFNGIGESWECGIGFYNADGQWLLDKYNLNNATISKFTTPENCTLMTLCFFNHSHNISSYTHIMLNEGNTALPYEPFTSNEFALQSPVELGKWDYILPQTGEIVRRTNTFTLTGEEPWVGGDITTSEITNWSGPNTCGFYVYFKKGTPNGQGINQPNGRVGTNYDFICNNLICRGSLWRNDVVGFVINNSYVGIRVSRSLLADYGSDNSSAEVNKTAFKAWLADMYAKGDPVIVSYEVMDEFKTIETLDCPKEYTAYNGGSETVVQGVTDNSQWGAIPTPTITYLEKLEGNYFLKVPIKKCVGNNLLNAPSVLKFKDYTTKYYFPVDLNGTYSFSFFVKAYKITSNASFVRLTVDGAARHVAIWGFANKRVSYTVTGHITAIDFINWCDEECAVTEIMLNEGDTALPYEPYTEWYEY